MVANGKDVYERVLHNPAQMPKDITFEALLYIPSAAYERKTGNQYDYTPAYPIETYSNQESPWECAKNDETVNRLKSTFLYA